MSLAPGNNIGQTDQYGGRTYVWDGSKWKLQKEGGAISSSSPPNPSGLANGTLWLDETTMELYTLLSGSWIEIANSPDIDLTDYYTATQIDNAFYDKTEILEATSPDTGFILHQRDARLTYFERAKSAHFLNITNKFDPSEFNGFEIDTIYRKMYEMGYHIQWLESEIAKLNGGISEPPPDATNPTGEWEYIGYNVGDPGVGNFSTPLVINDWSQLSAVYVSDTDLDGEIFDLSLYPAGTFLDIHKYSGDPISGADYSVSAVLEIQGASHLTGYSQVGVQAVPGTYQGIISVGDTYSIRSIDPATLGG